MNVIDRRLIELNEALLKLTAGEEIDGNLLIQARTVLAGGRPDLTTVLPVQQINSLPAKESESPPNKVSVPELQRVTKGDTGPKGDTVIPEYSVVLINDDYTISLDDYYVGVQCDKDIIITLPNPAGYMQCVVKSEMGHSDFNITILTENAPIDGNCMYILNQPYEFVVLIFREEKWLVIGTNKFAPIATSINEINNKEKESTSFMPGWIRRPAK